MSQYKVNFDKLDWEVPVEGMESKTFHASNKQLRLVIFYKNMEPHWCEKGHYGYVLGGEMKIEYKTEEVLYQTGDGVFIPQGPEHKHRAIILTDSIKLIFVEDL